MAARVMKTNLKRLAKGRASAKRIGKSIGGYHVFARQVAKTIPGSRLEKCGNWLLVGNNWMAALRGSEQQASASYGHYSYENPLQRCVSLHAHTRST